MVNPVDCGMCSRHFHLLERILKLWCQKQEITEQSLIGSLYDSEWYNHELCSSFTTEEGKRINRWITADVQGLRQRGYLVVEEGGQIVITRRAQLIYKQVYGKEPESVFSAP